MKDPDCPNVLAITDRLREELIAPPLSAGLGACEICRDWGDQLPRCSKCLKAERLLGAALTPVVPITLYVKPSPMRDRLKYYKDPRADVPGDADYAVEVGALVERFFAEHKDELFDRYGAATEAVVVPTKARPVPQHPLAIALDALPALSVPHRELVLALGEGPIARREPHPRGFAADPSVSGRSFLVLDDVYTTGATAQSAAYALRAAGAKVPAIVVVGRRLNPDAFPEIADLVERQRAVGYDFTRSLWESTGA